MLVYPLLFIGPLFHDVLWPWNESSMCAVVFVNFRRDLGGGSGIFRGGGGVVARDLRGGGVVARDLRCGPPTTPGPPPILGLPLPPPPPRGRSAPFKKSLSDLVSLIGMAVDG